MALLPFIAQEGRIAGAPAFVVSPRLTEPSPADPAWSRLAPSTRRASGFAMLADTAGEFLLEPNYRAARRMGLRHRPRIARGSPSTAPACSGPGN
jgi:hypothetical protein